MQRFRVDLETFLGLAMPNQCYHAVRKWIFGKFVGGILCQETPNLKDPYVHNTAQAQCHVCLRVSICSHKNNR